MNILALDLGLSVGWARSDRTCGCLRFDGGGDHGAAVASFRAWLRDVSADSDFFAVERGFGGNGANGRLTTALELTAHSVAWERGVRRIDASAHQARKALLGYASISAKQEPSKVRRDRAIDAAIRAAVQARGFVPDNEHAADAAAMLLWAECRGE